jgi:MFS family permease
MNKMVDWYTTGTPNERRTFWACFSGWALDTFDLQVFNYVIPSLMLALHLSKADAGSIATVALLSSAIGGWIGGILSDRYGRVRMLAVTIAWFTFFGVVAGFAQSYGQLIVCRALQGIGFGGEWAIGAALMAEIIAPKNRGKAMGLVQSGYSVGLFLASVVTMAIVAWFPSDMAWRVAFWFGVIPAALVLWIARGVTEPEIFTRMRNTPAAAPAHIGAIFKRGVLRSTILSSILLCGLQSASYALVSWMPTLLIQTRGMSPNGVITATVIVSVGAFAGFAVCAYACDRFGRKPCLISFSVAGMILTAIYTMLPSEQWVFMALGFPIGFTVNGMFAAVGPYLSEQFPTNVRAAGMGFTYNIGKLVGAFSVMLVGILASYTALASAIEIFCAGGFLVAIIALICMPETRGRELDTPLTPKDDPRLSDSDHPVDNAAQKLFR